MQTVNSNQENKHNSKIRSWISRVPWIATGAALASFITIWIGITEYRSAQKWKRSEFAARQVGILHNDKKLSAAVTFFRWRDREILLPDEYTEGYGKSVFKHSWVKLLRALESDKPEKEGSPDDAIYLDILDTYFAFIEVINYHLEIELMDVPDVENICRGATRITTNRFDTDRKVLAYLKRNDYQDVLKFIDKCAEQ